MATDFSLWKYRARVYINTTATGANITATVSNFPALVRLTTSNFTFSEASATGADIRFTSSDSNDLLSYEIESWTASTAEIWVKIPTILSNNSSQFFMMYWGNSTVASLSSSTSVFDTANGFAAVWHLNETPTGAGSIKDRTINHNDATTSGMDSTNMKTAVVDGGLYFNGVSNTATIPNSTTLVFNGAFSFYGWLYERSQRVSVWEEGLLSKADSMRYFIRGDNDAANKYKQGIYYGSGMLSNNYSDSTIPLGSWKHFGFTTVGGSGGAYSFYLNGVADGTGTLSEAIVLGSNNIIIDSAFDAGQDGTFDEFRVDTTARAVSWMKLNYETQRSDTTVLTWTKDVNNSVQLIIMS